MEVLYDELDNYNDVNDLQELRTENKRLRETILKYETSLEELKIDYDRLETEYKKLEFNYSSLLRTARSEIERKTSQITQLNQEKDIMVLESIKRGTKLKRHFNKVSEKGKNYKKANEDDKGKNLECNKEKLNSAPQAKEVLPSLKPDSKSHANKVEVDGSKRDSSKNRKNSIREDTKTDNRDTPDKKLKDNNLSSKTDNKSRHDSVGSKKDTSKDRKSSVGENVKTGEKDLMSHDKKTKDTPSSSKTESKSREADNVPSKNSVKDRKGIVAEGVKSLDKDSDKKSKNALLNFKADNKSHYNSKEETSKTNLYESKKSNVTETFKTDICHKRASSIRDRRKSTPAFISVAEPKFSSDEGEQGCQSRHSRVDTPPMENYDRRYLDKVHIDRESNRTSETSSIEERGLHYYDSSRETYRNRFDKHHPASSYVVPPPRRMEQYGDRSRRHYSPDREHRKRQYREYHQDDYHRQDLGRYRHTDSPPRDLAHRHQRRIINTRDNYDKYLHDYDKYRHDDKHRHPNDYDEPHSKRQKFESYNSNIERHHMDEHRFYPEREPVSRQPNLPFSPHELDIPDGSCQSPDFEHNEVPSHTCKEIMATAEAPLADPRKTSACYTFINTNGYETLSTKVGRNVDIIPVDRSKWDGVVNVDLPDALKRRPSQCSEEIIKDLYTDLDNPADDVTLEPGELCDDEYNFECSRNRETETQDIMKDFDTPQPSEQVSKSMNNSKVIPEEIISKLKIPKVGQPKKRNVDISNTDTGDNNSEINLTEKSTPEDRIPKKSLPKLDDIVKHDNTLSNKVEVTDKSRSDSQTTLAKMAIVADDLELSDENSDNVDTHTEITSKGSRHSSKVLSKIKATIEKDSKLIKEDESRNNNPPIDKVQISICNEEKIDSDNTTKLKSKRKRSKSKEASKELLESKDSTQNRLEDAMVQTKTTEPKPLEVKHKFSDLFGDSNSLMTPEDLGIPTYLPISEDAQNAVDLEINKTIDSPTIVDNKDSLTDKSNFENKKERDKISEDDTVNVLQPSNVVSKEVTKGIKKKRASKRKEDRLETNKISPTNLVDVNLQPETKFDEPNVVTTVIISKGVQPSLSSENNEEILVEKPAVNVLQPKNYCDKNPGIMDFKKLNLKALATSTPCKEFSAVNSIQTDSRSTHLVNNPNNDNVDVNKNAAQIADQSDSNTVDSLDAPDVRIFVKRRRKTLKRPPMT